VQGAFKKRRDHVRVKFEVTASPALASVLTTESVQDPGLRVGDKVSLIIKAIHVLPVKE